MAAEAVVVVGAVAQDVTVVGEPEQVIVAVDVDTMHMGTMGAITVDIMAITGVVVMAVVTLVITAVGAGVTLIQQDFG